MPAFCRRSLLALWRQPPEGSGDRPLQRSFSAHTSSPSTPGHHRGLYSGNSPVGNRFGSEWGGQLVGTGAIVLNKVSDALRAQRCRPDITNVPLGLVMCTRVKWSYSSPAWFCL